ncbi:hypothetical protein ABB37_04698 [Leptomonas pyrrhocoris]|uniref:EF-hand domain-containing protein n=1 Tax=Leptomonas pyrrhocoris TaxID=157538 RepID=A0A0M9G1W2_LEPPY|nr:hypothetical protein ABB37_04698 [Leptomonas pyrrhocoris]XP_015658916.1 hypothetical protein ABB37_04698 [Leptomonas pyrrhocoris]XP_015658917.1 hypothetical protein ABB37_04698 [Leptomonas pyrrhocoris]KPA80476.1 hypothetical protein ABB37_04698 [Leptomonas pyrrhocoris]KPA80477.1 hypothetical protein ABB37_04698 [Leptomonas pyrrhocoris]KPA80478.1 hypothetical protein ABB37_04698 [Leptomonas pyrrhocoris]|eukprot:XP_015658915.1 hypothetical protein ABB37_04698 [Leptomonas pyrrhocoris]
MSSSSVARTSTVRAADAAAAAPRFYDRLDATSKERVTLLLSKVQALLPIEQDAFLQELQRQQEGAQDALFAVNKSRGKLVRYTGPRLEAVQARERGYVMPRALRSGKDSDTRLPLITDGTDAPSGSRTALPCSLEELARTPGLFGETEVTIHLEKMSLYEKLHQNMAEPKGAEGPTDDVAASPPAQSQLHDRSGEMEMDLRRAAAASDAETAASAPRRNAPYRSNAYQAVRLAMSSPGFIPVQKPLSLATTQTGYDGVKSVLNTTGMPISEDDLREWFDELDEEGRGELSLDEFQRCMELLERDFGVTDEYAALRRAGEHLAFDGRLSFEAFAYLVLRFARV